MKKLGQKLMESERMVAIYESKWWRGSQWVARMLRISLEDEMSLVNEISVAGPADTVLDLACGPGLYARDFAEECPDRQVIGLDFSWPMLRYATKKAKRLGIENVIFVHGDAHDLPFKDSSLDAANCCGAVHLFTDVRRALRELYRVLKPNGRFSTGVFLFPSARLSRVKAYLDEKFVGLRYFREKEFIELLAGAGFEPTVYHAQGIWMIAGGVRRSGGSDNEGDSII